MKQTIHIALALALCLPLMLTGCSSSPTESSGGLDSANSSSHIADDAVVRKPFSEIRESFESDVEAIKGKEYDNLNFDEVTFSPPPQIDSISELKLVRLAGKSTDEIYDYFCKALDKLTDNKYTDEEKRFEIRFYDAQRDESLPYPYQWPNIDDYKNGQETNDPWPLLNGKNNYLWLGGGVIIEFNNGDLVDYEGVDRADVDLGQYSMYSNGEHQHVFYTEDLTCTDTYRLIDGEISIADAAKFAQNYIDEFDCTPYDANMSKPLIYAINVFDIGGGCYGYDFMISYTYNDVWFDRYENKNGGRGWSGFKTDYDERNYGSWMGCIDMIRTDKINRFADITQQYEIVEGEPTTEIITVGSAADAVSEFFSGYMNFNVTEVSMVWLQTSEYNASGQQEAYPCWKFKMYVDNELYHTFVNVITGEIYLYVQVV